MIRNILYACICLILFSGCVSITKELPSYKTYSVNSEKKASIVLNSSINIKEPKVIPSLNSKALYYSKDNLLEKYALSKLSDKPAKMIQEQIASYFSSSNFIYTSNIKTKSNFVLFSELNSFKQVFKNDASYAKFSIRVYLKNSKTKELSYKNFDYKIKCPTNDAKGAILGLNDSLSHFLLDLESFLENNIKNVVAKRNK